MATIVSASPDKPRYSLRPPALELNRVESSGSSAAIPNASAMPEKKRKTTHIAASRRKPASAS